MKQRKQKAAQFEIDVADRLIQDYGDRLRYVTGIGWLVWVGTHWGRDEQDKSREDVKAVLAKLRIEAASLKDDDLWKLCKSVSTSRGIGSILKLADPIRECASR